MTEADVTAPTDAVSVEPMTECYDATRPKTRPTDPASVDVMTGCYKAANNETPRAESTTPMERLRVTRTHADGAVLRCAYHGLKAQGYVRTPFHGGRIAGWKLVNSLTKIPIRLDARAANVVSVTAKVGGQNA